MSNPKPSLLAQAVASDALSSHQCNLLAPENEYLDPNPDIHTLFQEYNKLFFEGKLAGCEVKWSKRMTLCFVAKCWSVLLSAPEWLLLDTIEVERCEPLLKLRPRSDLVNTLLHEMIHAYVFVATPVRDHDDHGPIFQAHMHRINTAAMTQITVYHTFHDEVDSYRQHIWQCNGPCRTTPPYFGLVKRSMNRTPGPTDFWWTEHQHKCGGSYTKIKEPAEYTAKQAKKKERQLAREEKQKKKEKEAKAAPSVTEFFHAVGTTADQTKPKAPSAGDTKSSRKREMALPQQGGESSKKTKTDKHGSSGIDSGLSIFGLPSSGPVIFSADGDNDYFLVGDVQALLQFGEQESQALFAGWSSRNSNNDATKGTSDIVDLTASDSDESGGDLNEDKRAAPPATVSGNAGDPDVIEID